jgi:hypothetical protein
VIIARPLSASLRPLDRAVLGHVLLFTPALDRSGPLRSSCRYDAALPSAYRTLSDANQRPCEWRRLSPTRLHPQS